MDNNAKLATLAETNTRQALEKNIFETITNYDSKTGHSHDAPFLIGDLEKAAHNVLRWRRLLPRVEIFYAVKCNSEPPLLKYLADLGTSFDCASQREIETILDLGVDPSRIIFSKSIKPVSDLKYAEAKGVDLMVFDNQDELDKIKKSFPSARLLIRLQCEPSEHALFNFGMKFGCPLSEVEQLLVKAKNDNLNVVGVHFHAGSYVTNTAVFNEAIRNSKSVFETAQKVGLKLDILDIGGGFMCGEGIDSFDKAAENLNKMFDEYFPEDEQVRVIGEPGRFLAAPVYTWVIKVIGKRSNENLQQGVVFEDGLEKLVAPRFIYYVNDGLYGLKPYGFHNTSTLRPLMGEAACKDKTYPSLVFGPTCASTDVVQRDVALPELYIGDWLYATNSGAYSISMTTDFNMMSKPIVVYNVDEKTNL